MFCLKYQLVANTLMNERFRNRVSAIIVCIDSVKQYVIAECGVMSESLDCCFRQLPDHVSSFGLENVKGISTKMFVCLFCTNANNAIITLITRIDRTNIL